MSNGEGLKAQWNVDEPRPVVPDSNGGDFRDEYEQEVGGAEANLKVIAQSIGAGLTPRVTSGWTALREKQKAAEAGLDDTALELTKMAILGGLPDNKLKNDTELRLGEVEDGDLIMVWVRSGNEMLLEGLRVPRKLYEDIRDDKDDWQPLRDKVSAGMYVDMLRLLLAAA